MSQYPSPFGRPVAVMGTPRPSGIVSADTYDQRRPVVDNAMMRLLWSAGNAGLNAARDLAPTVDSLLGPGADETLNIKENAGQIGRAMMGPGTANAMFGKPNPPPATVLAPPVQKVVDQVASSGPPELSPQRPMSSMIGSPSGDTFDYGPQATASGNALLSAVNNGFNGNTEAGDRNRLRQRKNAEQDGMIQRAMKASLAMSPAYDHSYDYVGYSHGPSLQGIRNPGETVDAKGYRETMAKNANMVDNRGQIFSNLVNTMMNTNVPIQQLGMKFGREDQMLSDPEMPYRAGIQAGIPGMVEKLAEMRKQRQNQTPDVPTNALNATDFLTENAATFGKLIPGFDPTKATPTQFDDAIQQYANQPDMVAQLQQGKQALTLRQGRQRTYGGFGSYAP